MRDADVVPSGGRRPYHVTGGGPTIKLVGARHWLYATDAAPDDLQLVRSPTKYTRWATAFSSTRRRADVVPVIVDPDGHTSGFLTDSVSTPARTP